MKAINLLIKLIIDDFALPGSLCKIVPEITVTSGRLLVNFTMIL